MSFRRRATLRPFEPPALPALNRLVSAADRIQARWPDVVANPPETDRERLVAEMNERLKNDRWDGATMRLATSAARAVFDESRRERADLSALRGFYIAETRESSSSTFVGGMASVYVGSFVPDAPHTRALSEALKANRSRLGARWSALLERVPEFFDPVRAPSAIAALMTLMPNPWDGLKAIGLRSPHAPGLMDHAHIAFVQQLQPALRSRAGLDRLFGWLKPERQSPRMSGASEAIAAILGHWRIGTPLQDDLTHITQTLIGFYGDPRVHPGGAWAGVPSDLMDVLLRWLTGENIRFFMDVVSDVEDSHMWEPRRRFWLGLHDRGRIDAAWVAFSKSGAELARRRLMNRSGSKLQFGVQTAGGGRVNTSLLILKIGNRIVVEGSHSYKVHIFRASNPRAPRLYQSHYDCEMIRLEPGADARSHVSGWEAWVLERI